MGKIIWLIYFNAKAVSAKCPDTFRSSFDVYISFLCLQMASSSASFHLFIFFSSGYLNITQHVQNKLEICISHYITLFFSDASRRLGSSDTKLSPVLASEPAPSTFILSPFFNKPLWLSLRDHSLYNPFHLVVLQVEIVKVSAELPGLIPGQIPLWPSTNNHRKLIFTDRNNSFAFWNVLHQSLLRRFPY
jgi:hypothetical protein